MKSRRHKAIDKSEKEITMCELSHKDKKIKKWLKKDFKIIDRIYYNDMNKLNLKQRIGYEYEADN